MVSIIGSVWKLTFHVFRKKLHETVKSGFLLYLWKVTMNTLLTLQDLVDDRGALPEAGPGGCC